MTTGAVLEADSAPGYVGPAYSWTPPRRGTFGPDAVDLIRLAGREPDPDQIAAIDQILSFGPRGRLIALEQVLVESRQNGKTDGVVLPVVVFDLFELCSVAPDRIVWTAHQYKTAQQSFESMCNVIDSCPELSRDVANIRYSHGEQGVDLRNGSTLDFVARSGPGSARGLGGKRLILDEGLIISPGVIGSTYPLMSARPNPQITIASSAPKADAQGAHLRSLMRRGRQAALSPDHPDPSLVYLEYSAPGGWGVEPCWAERHGDECEHGRTLGCNAPPCEQGRECRHLYGTPGCALDDHDGWRKAGHSTGVRVTWEYVEGERRSMSTTAEGVLEFGRERCGWAEFPPNDDGLTVVDMTQWDALADVTVPAPTGQGVAIGIDVPPDQSATSIAVAWWWAGRRWVMVHRLNGTGGAAKFVRGLWDKGGTIDIGLQAGGPAGSLLNPLAAEGIDVRSVSAQEIGQGVGAWIAAVRDALLGHLAQPELYAAQKAVKLRKIGDAVMWARDDLTDLSPLYAATIAFNALGGITEEDTGPNVW